MFYGDIFEGVENLKVHCRIFDFFAIETTNKSNYPDTKSLTTYTKMHNSIHNKKGKPIEYRDAINFFREDT